MRYRKKPIVVEARQFTGGETNGVDLLHWITGKDTDPKVYHDTVFRLGSTSYWRHQPEIRVSNGELAQLLDPEHLEIRTLEGTMRADVGDWIIKGVQGEFYPCKPDIFEATYEPAE